MGEEITCHSDECLQERVHNPINNPLISIIWDHIDGDEDDNPFGKQERD